MGTCSACGDRFHDDELILCPGCGREYCDDCYSDDHDCDDD